MRGKLEDLKGKTFDMLTVVKRYGSDEYGNALWECDCECGYKGYITSAYRLKNGICTSCGCKRIARIKELNKKRASKRKPNK